jgi:PqqD family protein of HPr-rel-A system
VQSGWGITPGCRLLWRSWESEHIVYNTGSGDTHLVDSISALLLKSLEPGPLSEEDLASLVRHRVASDSHQDAATFARQLLEQFHALGLIEPVTL